MMLNNHNVDIHKVPLSNTTSGIVNDMFSSIYTNLEVRATWRLPDVPHAFDRGETSIRVFPIKHLGVAGVEFTDETAVLVTGMVRFPASRTANHICGLQFATVSAYKGRKCDSDAISSCSVAGYMYDSDPEIYYADKLGHFEISLTPGETWAFVASYKNHNICYGGDSLDVAACSLSSASQSLILNNDKKDQNVYVEIENIVGDEVMIFFDVTEREVDIGLFAGACGTHYSDYSLKITPANGCGSTVIVQSTDIISSRDWDLIKTTGYRRWPYAAMDYYIELDSVPDVSWLNEARIRQDNGVLGSHSLAASCTEPGSGFKQYFEERNILVQTLLLLDSARADAKYTYHGFFCALPTFGPIISESENSAFTAIDADEICLGSDAGNLTSEHLIGQTDPEKSTLAADDVSTNKYVALKIFEAHQTANQTIDYCYTFRSEIDERPTQLGVSVRIQQDVGPQSSNRCHSSNEPSSNCLFTNVNEYTGYLQFESSTAFEIDSAGALPNLVRPHRRKFLARLERYDGWYTTNLEIHRELVPLASKIRGESSDPNARCLRYEILRNCSYPWFGVHSRARSAWGELVRENSPRNSNRVEFGFNYSPLGKSRKRIWI